MEGGGGGKVGEEGGGGESNPLYKLLRSTKENTHSHLVVFL